MKNCHKAWIGLIALVGPGITITVSGVAKVRWTEKKSRYNRQTKKFEDYEENYNGDEQYVHSQDMVAGPMLLPPGEHEYIFSAALPPKVPSSITDEYGHVAYEVILRLHRAIPFDNEYSSYFTVVQPLDLNLDPSYMEPSVAEEEKEFGFWCCTSGTVISELRTDFSGYAPGQTINFTLLVDNDAKRDMNSCEVEFIQSIDFTSLNPDEETKNVENVIGECELGGVDRYSKELLQDSFKIPPLPPSTVNSSGIIDVSYFIRATIETGRCTANKVLETDITIGTMPLKPRDKPPQDVITVQPTAPDLEPDDDGGIPPPPQYDSIVPPNFTEATQMNKPFIDRELADNRVHNPYVPMYPMFHGFATPSVPPLPQPFGEQSKLLSDPGQSTPQPENCQGPALGWKV